MAPLGSQPHRGPPPSVRAGGRVRAEKRGKTFVVNLAPLAAAGMKAAVGFMAALAPGGHVQRGGCVSQRGEH